MRVDKFLSLHTQYSRKMIKQLIREQRVSINNVCCKDNSQHITESDSISLDQQVIPWVTDEYYVLYKPEGYCCSHVDDGHPSALHLLPPSSRKLHFAGRLDADTTGLVLISSDGQWCHRITSPKQRERKDKVYRVTLAQPLSDDDHKLLEEGIQLHSEPKPTLPAQLEQLDDTCYRLTIQEGMYHQVKRMFAAVGNQVIALHREQVGPIQLDSALESGEYRPLTPAEIDAF